MGYTPDWWEREGDRIKAERNRRYREDPEYREKAKARAQRYREQKQKEREEFLANPFIELHGKQVPALTAEQVCQRLGITATRLKYLQRVGYLPKALHTTPFRLYTYSQEQHIKSLHQFLLANAQFLRTPKTDAGQAATTALDTLVSTITANWEK